MYTIALCLNCNTINRLLLTVLLVWSAPVLAVVGINQKVFTKLQTLQGLVESKQFDSAQDLLAQLYQQKLNGHERAQVHNLHANLWLQQNQYNKAMSLFSQVVDAKDIPDGLRQNGLRMLMQLHMAQNNYQQALDYSERLILTLADVDAPLLALRAQCLLQIKQYSQAEEAINNAIDLAQRQGQPPQENWLLILNAIYHSQEDYSAMVPVLNRLLGLYPKDRYAYTLAAVYGQLQQRKKQLLLLEPLYDAGYLTQKNQITLLAQLMMAEGVPVKAANILEQHVNQSVRDTTSQRDLETLAQAWLMARELERALGPLQAAAKLADNGEPYLRLAYVYHSLNNWPKVVDAVSQALIRGQLHNQGNALVLLGMAQYKQQDYASAIATFSRASGFSSVTVVSQQWQAFVESQQEKHQLLAVQ